jgi:NADPH2:quinone reductase
MSLPDSMTIIAADGAGGPEVLKPATAPLPVPKPDEVLIRVLACGVNRPDVAQRKGHYPPPPGASPIIGLEVAGEVVGRGAAATSWQIGDRVTALVNGGGYAEYCVAPQTQCLPWPKGYDAVRAAAIPETYFTVWANLFQIGGLAAGKAALVHGGTSGIGVTAIQLAREVGAAVYATAGSAEKCAACVKLGATAAINYREQDFVAEIKRLTEARGVDVVMDMVAGDYVDRDLRCLGFGGKLVLIAMMGGRYAEKLDLGAISRLRLTITGSTMRPRTTADKGVIAQELREQVWPALDAGRCGPVIFQTFPLGEAAAAHRLMESSTHIGKIMLTVAD